MRPICFKIIKLNGFDDDTLKQVSYCCKIIAFIYFVLFSAVHTFVCCKINLINALKLAFQVMMVTTPINLNTYTLAMCSLLSHAKILVLLQK